MPEPIRPVPSHAAPTAATDPALAQRLLAQLADVQPLTEDDFAYLYQKALESKENADKVRTWLDSNNVTATERQGFYDYVNRQNAGRDATGYDTLRQHLDPTIMQVGSVELGPGAAAVGYGAARAVGEIGGAVQTGDLVGAAKTAWSNAAPILKYEVIRHALRKAGVPGADEIAYTLTRGRAEPSPVPAVASPAATAPTPPIPSAPMTATPPMTHTPTPTAPKPFYNASEFTLAQRLAASGFSKADAFAVVEFMKRGLSLDEAVARVKGTP